MITWIGAEWAFADSVLVSGSIEPHRYVEHTSRWRVHAGQRSQIRHQQIGHGARRQEGEVIKWQLISS